MQHWRNFRNHVEDNDDAKVEVVWNPGDLSAGVQLCNYVIIAFALHNLILAALGNNAALAKFQKSSRR